MKTRCLLIHEQPPSCMLPVSSTFFQSRPILFLVIQKCGGIGGSFGCWGWGGGGGGVIGDFRKKTSCRMISKEKISALKKNLMAYNAGKKTYTVIWRGKFLTKPNHPHLPRPPPQKSNGRLGPGKSKMADVYSVGTQVDLLYLFITWDVTLVEF